MVLGRKHLPQIFIHVALWLSFYGLMLYPMLSQSRPIHSDLLAKFFMLTVLFYFNYFYLVPKLLLSKNILTYVIASIVLIIVSVLLINIAFPPDFPKDLHFQGPTQPLLQDAPPLNPPPQNMPPRMPRKPDNGYGFLPFFMGLITIGIPYSISAILRMYVEWNKNEDLRKIVEKVNIQSELQFLKTQLNPHFLFNSLNAIYALSVKKSPDTSQAIVNLSELMRYMLYETDKDLVPLGKEIEYIKSYVQLQRLRLSDSENVNLNISGEDKGKVIPPLLFISFIENAFKYGTDYQGKTDVRINLSIEDTSIKLIVKNKIGVFNRPSKSSGIGLENVRNRLKLLYPNAHELVVENNGETYTVNLTLTALKQDL